MEPEKQVCALEQAKKLAEIFKKAGIDPAESYFKWIIRIDPGGAKDEWTAIPWEFGHLYHFYHDQVFNAYTDAELDVWLPHKLPHPEQKFKDKFSVFLVIRKLSPNSWQTCYRDDGGGVYYKYRSYPSTHAKADLLIQLFDEKLLKPEDLKL